jgi:hypothetical protein
MFHTDKRSEVVFWGNHFKKGIGLFFFPQFSSPKKQRTFEKWPEQKRKSHPPPKGNYFPKQIQKSVDTIKNSAHFIVECLVFVSLASLRIG